MDDSSPTGTVARRKLPARYFNLVLPLILSALMTCVVSLISTWRSVGLVDEFVELWLGAWALSWVVAFPLLLVVLPLARTVTRFWVEDPP
jgi:Protein of unknown function (DUF2798)